MGREAGLGELEIILAVLIVGVYDKGEDERQVRGGVMLLTEADKRRIKRELAERLGREGEVCKVIIFGSFISSAEPRDVDVAVFQDSAEGYLPLAMKYRRLTRSVAAKIPLDIVPLKATVEAGAFAPEIDQGEVIYER